MIKRLARLIFALLICAGALTSGGCASILEDESMSVSPHASTAVSMQPGSAPEATNYGELVAELLALVPRRAESGKILIYSYDGDIYEDIERACFEIKNNEPIGAYALSDITASATQFVSYYEVDAELTFTRTKAQLDSIVTVSTLRYFRSELLRCMSEYKDEAVVMTELHDISAEDIAQYVRELYYENPLDIVILPSLGVEFYPADSENGPRIIGLTFSHRWSGSMLASYNKHLRDTVSRIVETVSGGDNDGAILLELAQKLADSCVYNSGRIAEHGVQVFEATAYGALIDADAVGEGFAMAFKALCDELEFECHVVLGTLDGAAHAWNIVALEGNYYHIDVAMCAENGIETAFLLRDADMPENYQWDRGGTQICDGELTYYDFAESEEEDNQEKGGD